MLPVAPDSTCFHVVYDIRRSLPGGSELPFLEIPIFLLGFWAYRHHRSSNSMEGVRATLIGFVLMALAVFGLLFFINGSLLTYIAIRTRVARGAYEVLEGVITEFRSGYAGTRLEQWTLQTRSGQRTYAYSEHVLAGGYDGTTAAGSLLRTGLRVRVYDVRGRIARLEVECRALVPTMPSHRTVDVKHGGWRVELHLVEGLRTVPVVAGA